MVEGLLRWVAQIALGHVLATLGREMAFEGEETKLF